MRNPVRLVVNAGSIDGWRVLSFPLPAATGTVIEATAAPLVSLPA